MPSQWNESSYTDQIVSVLSAVKAKVPAADTFPQWIDSHPTESWMLAAAAGASVLLFILHRSDIPPEWYVKMKASLRRMGTMKRTKILHEKKIMSLLADEVAAALDKLLEANKIKQHDVDFIVAKLGNHVPLQDLLPMKKTVAFVKSGIRYRMQRAETKRNGKTVKLNSRAPIPGETPKAPKADALTRIQTILRRNDAAK